MKPFQFLLFSAALLLVLFLVFRNLRMLFVSALPLLTGFLAGLTTVALLFDTVHGITLAFGFTLLGIAIDFPLHLFSHSRQTAPRLAMQRIWPTLRAGAASTLLAYLALALSGSPGLAQLGTFTAAGLIGAVAITRLWLPDLLPPASLPGRECSPAPQTPSLAFLPAAFLAAIAVGGFFLLADGSPWHDAPESISPVPAERLAADQRLRSALSSVDLRFQVAIDGDTVDDGGTAPLGTSHDVGQCLGGVSHCGPASRSCWCSGPEPTWWTGSASASTTR